MKLASDCTESASSLTNLEVEDLQRQQHQVMNTWFGCTYVVQLPCLDEQRTKSHCKQGGVTKLACTLHASKTRKLTIETEGNGERECPAELQTAQNSRGSVNSDSGNSGLQRRWLCCDRQSALRRRQLRLPAQSGGCNGNRTIA